MIHGNYEVNQLESSLQISPLKFLLAKWIPSVAMVWFAFYLHVVKWCFIHRKTFLRFPSRCLWRNWHIWLFFPWCRWKKSCTTWDVWIPVNNGRNYQAQLVPTTYVWYGAYGPHIFPLSPLLIFINFSCFKASCSILRLPHDLLIPSSKGHTGILEFAPTSNFPNWKEVAWSLGMTRIIREMVFPLPHLILRCALAPGCLLPTGRGQCSGSNSIIDPVWNLLLPKCFCPQNGVGVFLVHHPQPP